MSVDVGLDIVATKGEKMFGVQVKTANLNKYNTYVFSVRKASFERHSSSNIFYIFVLHGEHENKFLIIPFHEMERKVSEGAILSINRGQYYRINIKIRDDRIFLGTMDHDETYYLNNWEIIK